MAFLTTKSSFYITLLVTIGCISPFVHIVYGITDQEGIFGYTYMSSFLNAFGRANALLCAGLFIKFASSKIDNEYKSIVNFGANMFLYVSCFFLLAIFIPKKLLFNKADFPASFYWISMLFLSIGSGLFFTQIQRLIIYTEFKLKAQAKKLFALSWNLVKSEKSTKEKEKEFFNVSNSIADEY